MVAVARRPLHGSQVSHRNWRSRPRHQLPMLPTCLDNWSPNGKGQKHRAVEYEFRLLQCLMCKKTFLNSMLKVQDLNQKIVHVQVFTTHARAQASSILPHPKRDLKMRHMNAESRKTYPKASKSLNHFSIESHGDMEIPHFEKCPYNAAIPWASSISPDCHQLWSSSQSLECCPALSFECAHRKPTDILAKFCGAPFDNESWLWEMSNLYVRNKEKSSIDRVFSITG